MRSYRLHGIIIKRRNFLEKDRVLTLLSKESGKTEVLAKGARRPGNRLSASCDLATAARFYVQKTKTIDIVSEIEPFFRPDRIRGQYHKTEIISYALKIVDQLYEQDEPHARTYKNLLDLLEAISFKMRQLLFLKFLLDVLEDLGAQPNFLTCPVCHREVTGKDEFMFAFSGGLTHQHCLDSECISISQKEIKLLRLLKLNNIRQSSNMKVDKATFEKTYQIMQKYFEHEFGRMLPDNVM